MKEPQSPDWRPLVLGGGCAVLILVHLFCPKAGVDMITIYLAVLGVLVLYREEIAQILGRIRHFKGAGMEVDLRSEVREARRHVEAASEAATGGEYEVGAVEATERAEEILRQGAGSPWATIVLVWGTLERAIIEAAEARDIAIRGVGGSAASRALRDLAGRGVVPRELVPAFEALRLARNRVAHGDAGDVSQDTLWYLINVGFEILALLPGPSGHDSTAPETDNREPIP